MHLCGARLPFSPATGLSAVAPCLGWEPRKIQALQQLSTIVGDCLTQRMRESSIIDLLHAMSGDKGATLQRKSKYVEKDSDVKDAAWCCDA